MDVVFETVIHTLQHHGVTLSSFLISLLTSRLYNNHPVVQDILAQAPDIFAALVKHPLNNGKLDRHVHMFVTEGYLAEIKIIAAEDAGWHFGVYCSTLKQFEEFSLDDMGRELEASVPQLWSLLGELLGSQGERMNLELETRRDADGDMVMDEDAYWDEVDEIDLEGFINELVGDGGGWATRMTTADKRMARRAAIVLIISIGIIILGGTGS